MGYKIDLVHAPLNRVSTTSNVHLIHLDGATRRICLQFSGEPGSMRINGQRCTGSSVEMSISFNNLSAFNQNIGKTTKKMFLGERDEALKKWVNHGAYMTDVYGGDVLTIEVENSVEIIGGHVECWIHSRLQ